MRAGNYRAIFTLAFALALAAGAAAGVLATRFIAIPTTPPPPSSTASSPTFEDLDLKPDQREQVRRIWEAVKLKSDQSYREAQKGQKELEQKVFDMLTTEQKARYQEIYQAYQDQFTRLAAERDAAVKKAIEQTKTLLSSTQREKYDAILKSRLGREGEPGRPPGLSQDGPNSPATRPAAPQL